MKRSFSILTGLCLGLLLSLAVATQATAQEKKAKKEKQDRLEGVVHMINKDTSTITIRRGNMQRQIVYSADTKFGKSDKPRPDKPATVDDIKEGTRIIVVGKFNDKTQLVASQISIRQGT